MAALAVAPRVEAQSRRGTPRVMQGPMLGAVGENEATVWARLSGPFRAGIRYGDDATFSEPRHSEEAVADKANDYVVTWTLKDLAAGHTYYYRVLVEGEDDPYLPGTPFALRTAPAAGGGAVFRVAFGSCARYGEDPVQAIWPAVVEQRPDLFFWLGDNIYGDALDPDILAEEYRRQRDVPGLQPLLRTVPQLAIWDDHDYGLNNQDRRNPIKRQALELFKRYWANPSAGLPGVPGVFFRYSYGGVDFFFLDVRYHRDPNDAPDGPGKTMLGKAQLAWLRRGLLESEAAFKVLVSGSGWSSAKGEGGDSWAAFAHERDALFDFVRDREISGVVLLSGDTHCSELNAIPWSTRGGYDLYDLVSSPLAQNASAGWLGRHPEMRIRPVYSGGPSCGLLELDTRDPARLRYVVIGPGGRTVGSPFELAASELRNGVVSWPRVIDPAELRRLELAAPGPWAFVAPPTGLPRRGLCAHRGAMDTHPENTLPAFAEAARLGVAMIEFDVRCTRDGRLVVIHDATVDRTTGGSGRVAELDFARIRSLDAGSWKDPRFAGLRVPTLREALAVMPENIWLNVHLKGGADLGAKTARVLLATGRLRQSFLACGAEAARAARAVCPGIRICVMDRQGGTPAYVDRTLRDRGAFIQLAGDLPEDIAARARRLRHDGVRINYYGTDDPADLERLLAAGIQFPLTNRPAAMTEEARRLGIEPVAPTYRGGGTGEVVTVDVRDLGARADGETDDAQAIQAALDAVAAVGGGRVLLPPADRPYVLRQTLAVTGDHVELVGPGATLRLADGAHRPRPDGSAPTVHCVHVRGGAERPVRGVALRGFTVDANYWAQPGAYRPRGIQVDRAADVTVEDVTVVRPWVGLTFGRGVARAVARRCRVQQWHNDAFSVTGDGETGSTLDVSFLQCLAEHARNGDGDSDNSGERDSGFEIEDGCADVTLVECAVRDADGNGFVVRNHRWPHAVITRRIRFERCRAEELGGRGFDVRGTTAEVTVRDVELAGCESDAPCSFDRGAGGIAVRGGAFDAAIRIGMDAPARDVFIDSTHMRALEATLAAEHGSALTLEGCVVEERFAVEGDRPALRVDRCRLPKR